MKHEIRHRAYKPTIGGLSVSGDGLINDLKKRATDYIGSFSEYNPIGYEYRVAAFIKKETTKSINQQKPFRLPGFKLKGAMGYHGSDFNCNYGVSFNKEDLLRIANAMDDTDTLHIVYPDNITDQFTKDIKIVTG